jgi:uncharacterized protein
VLTHTSDNLCHVFDTHAHAFPDKVAATAIPKLQAGSLWFRVRATFDGTVCGLVAGMDRVGIGRAIIASIATRPEQVEKITDWSVSVASDRLVPFASIHPDYASPEAEVERIAAAGLRGLKFHPHYMDCPADDPRVIRIARAAAAANLSMLFHSGHDLSYEKDDRASPARLRRVHEAAPGLRLAAAHLGGWECWDEVLRDLAGTGIYLETSFTLGRIEPDLLERILAKHPKDRILFGTDAPWTDPAEELGKFRALALPADTERRILWDNALRFVNMVDT